MLKYRTAATSLLSSKIRHLGNPTTSRARRIIFANVVCLILFVGTIFLARGGEDKRVALPGLTPLRTGEVYYVSKRALCSRSLAHEQLGIQPIAVSKVILRPVVFTEVDTSYDDRLEVLEESMINDVIFLDRNVSGTAAELASTACPLHTVKMLPPRKPPSRYSPSSVAFGVTMSANELPNTLEHWRFWAQKSTSFHILLPGSEANRVSEVKDLIRKELGIKAVVQSARDTDEPARLSMKLVQSMEKSAASRKEWFIILTPDTFVVSLEDVLLALEPYNSRHVLYMGSLSESLRQREQWGHMAYGGAGIILSRPLASILAKQVDDCIETAETPYGDGVLASCVKKHTSAELTILPTFHQCDLETDLTGFFQGPLEIATMYNVTRRNSLFPKWHPVGSESKSQSTYRDQIELFRSARSILSPENWGLRYRFGNNGRFVLTNGYSVTEFLRPPFPSNFEIRNGVEGTFHNDNNVEEFTFYAAHGGAPKEVPMRHGLREGDDKRTYYLRAIGYAETQANAFRTEKLNGEAKQAAVFVYTNEWGSVRRGIEVVWLL